MFAVFQRPDLHKERVILESNEIVINLFSKSYCFLLQTVCQRTFTDVDSLFHRNTAGVRRLLGRKTNS